MAANIAVRMSALEIANARRQATVLREHFAGRRSGNKIAVEVSTLRTILRLIDAVVRRGVARSRTAALTEEYDL